MSVVLQALFERFDGNRDGRFAKKEFAAMCYSMGHYLSDYELEVAFALIDANGSGFIERDEFERFWRTDARFDKVRLDDAQLAKMQQMGDYFRYFDVDNTGSLNLQEFARLCEHMKLGYDLEKIHFNVENLDRDGNGNITFNEYMSHMIGLGALDAQDGSRPLQ